MDTLLNSSVVEEKEPLEIGKCVGRLYDILAQVISVLDVTTDIMICYQFYAHGRIIFFTISLAILILALMSYSVLFVNVFSGESQCSRNLALFMVLLPVSPLIPFVFYYSGYPQKPDACLSIILKKICCFELDFDGPSPSKNASKFKQFFEKKVEQHAGFIIESLIEAFPQAILQMTAIVIYNETNITAIVSILISLLSVASKSFVFSLGAASNFKQLFFTWLCACCDFFGIFFMVSWVFWRPHDADLQDAFATIQQVWLYKLYIFTFPMILIPLPIGYCASICALFGEFCLFWNEPCMVQTNKLLVFSSDCGYICILLRSHCLFVSGIEITNWTWIALTFVHLGTSRFPTWNKRSVQFWFTILKWIKSGKAHHIGTIYSGCTSYTAKQDKMMRISAVNWIITSYTRKTRQDGVLMQYLEKHQTENQYMNVTMSGIRNNATNSLWKCNSNNAFWDWYSMIWRDVYSDRQEKMNQWRQNRTWRNCNDLSTHTIFAVATGLITFVFGPTYLIGRFAHLSFAVFIVLYLYLGYDINIWNTDKIDM
eukprot:174452_1